MMSRTWLGIADFTQIRKTAIGIAVFCFYCLDFALNGYAQDGCGSSLRLIHTRLQASLRNLVLDVTPGEQLAVANAWHGRFNHIGNIVGFTMGMFVQHLDVVVAECPRIPQSCECTDHPARWRWPISQRYETCHPNAQSFSDITVCIVALLILVGTVWLTCWTQDEEERDNTFGERRS